MSAVVPLLQLYNNLKGDTFINEGNNINDIDFEVNPWVGIFNTILTIYALYLSFKCNKGFKFGSFLFACCCSMFYIPYILAVSCK